MLTYFGKDFKGTIIKMLQQLIIHKKNRKYQKISRSYKKEQKKKYRIEKYNNRN